MTVPMDCPLCGENARLSLTNRVEWEDTYTVSCTSCGCALSRTGPVQSEATKRKVLAVWNARGGEK